MVDTWHGMTVDPIHKKVLQLLGAGVRKWVQTEEWERHAIPDGCEDCGWRLEQHGEPVWTMDANFVMGHHEESVWFSALNLSDLREGLEIAILDYAAIRLVKLSDGRIIAEAGELTSDFVSVGETTSTPEIEIAKLFIVACESDAIDVANIRMCVAI